jgi:hypothetical protein
MEYCLRKEFACAMGSCTRFVQCTNMGSCALKTRHDKGHCNWFRVEISQQQQVRSAGDELAPEREGPDDRADK